MKPLRNLGLVVVVELDDDDIETVVERGVVGLALLPLEAVGDGGPRRGIGRGGGQSWEGLDGELRVAGWALDDEGGGKRVHLTTRTERELSLASSDNGA